MKKIFFVLSGILFFCPLCFGQEPQISTSEVVPASVETKVFTGKVSLIDFEERTKDFPARIDAVDAGGQRLVFVVAKKIPIQAKDGKAILLRKIRKNDKITIEYTKEHKNKLVQSITVVE